MSLKLTYAFFKKLGLYRKKNHPGKVFFLNSAVLFISQIILKIPFCQQGRNFEASLRPNGLIESAGGETFRTPMAWMRAVTGSWTTVKQSQAYKMVKYNVDTH